ncbi:MAG: sporulation protein YabP [Clostridiales bacterium]|nr:sporulation protein YabP [Clostridiales bacterium]
MPYEELRPEGGHRLILEEREQLTVSGVEEVESFDENTIVMDTAQGTLVVRGEGLHIEKLSLDGGDLKVEGTVESLTYEESREKGGFFARLLR